MTPDIRLAMKAIRPKSLAWLLLPICTACTGLGNEPGSRSALPVVQSDSRNGAAVAMRIAGATNTFIQFHASPDSTRALYGAPLARECVATVQYILRSAGLNYIGASGRDGTPVLSVDDFRAALAHDKKHWQRIDLGRSGAGAGPGDIWVQGDGHRGSKSGQNHVGICQDRDCVHVVSNSSQSGSFTWSQSVRDYAAYYAARGYPYLASAAYHHR